MRTLAFVLLLVLGLFAPGPAAAQSDDEIKRAIIQQSIAAYPGNCPCPYNLARNGSRCGARSAYSKPGGYAPLCYPDDVTPDMLDRYRKAMKPGARQKPG